MTRHLDRPIRVGKRIFAAIVDVEISTHGVGPVLMAAAHKQPHTIQMMSGGKIAALELDGCVLTPEDTAHQYREAVAQLSAMQITPHNDPPDSSDLDQ